MNAFRKGIVAALAMLGFGATAAAPAPTFNDLLRQPRNTSKPPKRNPETAWPIAHTHCPRRAARAIRHNYTW